MSDLGSIIDSIYGQFLLRDLFAKMVPGSLVVLTAAITFPTHPDRYLVLGAIGWPVILLAAGFVWILGFAIQRIGEIFRLIRHHPLPKASLYDRNFDNTETRYRLRQDFEKKANRSEQQRVERYAVVKEACGNFATAILLAAVSLLIDQYASLIDRGITIEEALELGLIFIVWLALITTNRSHAEKHYQFMETVVGPEPDHNGGPSDD